VFGTQLKRPAIAEMGAPGAEALGLSLRAQRMRIAGIVLLFAYGYVVFIYTGCVRLLTSSFTKENIIVKLNSEIKK